MIYLDTHVAVWLRQGRLEGLPRIVRERLDREAELRISPMVVLEIDLLHEIGRIREGSAELVGALSRGLGLKVCDLPFPAVAAAASSLSWTRDPFDRMIVAQAAVADAPLVTKDRRLRERYRRATWDEASRTPS